MLGPTVWAMLDAVFAAELSAETFELNAEIFELSVELKPEVYALARAVASAAAALARAVTASLAWDVMLAAMAFEANVARPAGTVGGACDARWPASAVVAAPCTLDWNEESDDVIDVGTENVGASTLGTAGGDEAENPPEMSSILGTLMLGIFMPDMSGMLTFDAMDENPVDTDERPDEKPELTPSMSGMAADALEDADENPALISSFDGSFADMDEKPELTPSMLGMDILDVIALSPEPIDAKPDDRPAAALSAFAL